MKHSLKKQAAAMLMYYESGNLKDVSRQSGISYPTLRQWLKMGRWKEGLSKLGLCKTKSDRVWAALVHIRDSIGG